ncbi:polysaccharide deacetylase family protein [Bacillus sp. AGMB 02131]|uniref:Polysaccharide deacetylase family protein n=1 Tax=Peribacillus faecalis TaxID=2772559 RepID=A0A927CY83_9BACI|nr:polysaccharide deacetylase family protein [Peribacillus faecalis]MBD3109923.1 polysaccharide deacetylase family protein [Peribacillus faecalis]
MRRELQKKLQRKRVLWLLAGILALSGMAFVVARKGSTVAEPLNMDPTYEGIEISSILKEGKEIEYPIFHIEEVDDIISAYIQERLTTSKQLSYEIVHYSAQTATVQFTGSEMLETLNIDLIDGKLLSSTDLVDEAKTDEFMKRLSNVGYAQLATSNQEKFEDFILYNQSIVFNTSKGELAVSKQLFEDLLKDEYKAGNANKDLVQDREPKSVIAELPKKSIEDLLDKKVVALTFDDGPKKGTTDVILDALKKHNAHATFFVLGSMAEKSPELLRRMAEEGQEIGSHSYNHPQLTKLSDEEILAQLNQTKEVIQQNTGQEPTAFRPPYGSIDDRVRSFLGDIDVVGWNIDTEDWKYRDTNRIVREVMNKAADGKIILMHDIYKTSADAAVSVIEQLTAQGYEIVTASDMIEIKRRRMQVSEG